RSSARREGRAGVEQMTGRTPCDRIVVFAGNERLVGHIVPVEVEEVSAVTLFGRVVTTVSAMIRGEKERG
ncbi:MAG: TRAM domain-containing protein, partial [Singulisphaera sp.]